MSLATTGAGRSKGQIAAYLLRDKFLTDLTAGNLDGTAAEPGPGLRDVNDVESKIFTVDDRLRGGGQDSPVWGDSMLLWTLADGSGVPRLPGRALAALILPEDCGVDADVALGWRTAATFADPRTDGLGFLTEGTGIIKAVGQGATLLPYQSNAHHFKAMQYLVVVALDRKSVV